AIPETGAELELIAGTQGGFHVWVTARIWDLNPEGLVIAYEGTPVGASAPISYPTEIAVRQSDLVREGDHWVRAGDFLRFMISGPADIVGTEVDVRITATCVGGASAEDVRRATIVDRM